MRKQSKVSEGGHLVERFERQGKDVKELFSQINAVAPGCAGRKRSVFKHGNKIVLSLFPGELQNLVDFSCIICWIFESSSLNGDIKSQPTFVWHQEGK